MPNSPFIRVREVISSTPWSTYMAEMAPEVRKQWYMPYWSEDRLRRHLEMLRAFGFNSIQVNANPLMAIWGNAEPQAWRQRVVGYVRAARALGMQVSQFVWGAAIADPQSAHGQKFTELDWHNPADRARQEAWYRDQAELAPLGDRIITHWGDPGRPGCAACTLDSVSERHNVILAVFRAGNPQIRGALSTWFMGGEMGYTYPGYVSPGQVAAHPALEPGSEVVIGLMNYHSDGVNCDPSSELKRTDLAAIAATGRGAGVWGWYTADIEILPSLHVHTDLLQNYFRSLPAETRTSLAWHSLDDNAHGLNMQNLYVAAQLMIDPARDGQALLDEFVTGFVGPASAPAVAAALRAIEQVRTRSRRYDLAVRDATVPLPGPVKDLTPLPATWLQDSAAVIAAAQRGLATVAVPRTFTPAWPVTLHPADYLVELKVHLEAIRQMLAFLQAAQPLERRKAGGETTAQLQAAIEMLPVVTYDPAHTAGLETMVYRKKLAALQKQE